MFRKENRHGRVPLSGHILVLTLAVTVLLAGLVVSYAWMHYARTLQTVTLVKVADQTIVGPSEDSLAIKLGDVDVSERGSKDYVFGVKSVTNASYRIQLAHTQNIPFNYTIFFATKLDESEASPQTDVVLDDGLSFERLNPLPFIPELSKEYHKETYNDYRPVQPQAEPVYLLSDYISIDPDLPDTQYYILQITWEKMENNKETDMVYLTVGS